MSTDTHSQLPKSPTWLGWTLLICGIIGLIFSTIIMMEKLMILEDAGHVTSCDLNEVLSCGSVMRSGQASAFGVPNPFFGLAGFAVTSLIGAAILAGGRFKGWFWFGAQLGLTFATMFVHWLAYQSMFVIRALCPYCMVIWTITIIMFVMVTAWNVRTFSGSGTGIVRALDKSKILVAIVWIAAIGATALWAFRSYL